MMCRLSRSLIVSVLTALGVSSIASAQTVSPSSLNSFLTLDRSFSEKTRNSSSLGIERPKQRFNGTFQTPPSLLLHSDDSMSRINHVSELQRTVSGNRSGMAQMTNVSELRDVTPTDWAYEAFKSLVERYGCIVGYPDRTFLGDRALSRWEFAAGLNACVNTLERLLQENVAILKEDLETLRQLTKSFESELSTLGARVSNLETRLSYLEDRQFSTVTKLSGSTILAINHVFTGNNAERIIIGDVNDQYAVARSAQENDQVTAQYRHRLLFNTSFTGKDSLLIGIYSGNAPIDLARNNGFSFGGVDIIDTVTGESREVFSTDEGTLTSTIGAATDNGLLMLAAGYDFPIGDQIMISLSAGRAPFYFVAPILNGLYTSDEGTGAIGVFARQDPLYLLVSGGTGAAINYQVSDSLRLTAGYLADGGSVGDPSSGNGLFNGGYGILGQLTWDVADNFKVAAVYGHDYAPPGRFGFNQNGISSVGTFVANSLAGQDILGGQAFGLDQYAVSTNSYSFQFSWDLASNVNLSSWFNATYPRLIGRGNGEILTYALTLAVQDVGKDGNLLGFAAGVEPYLTHFSGGNPLPFKVDLPWHFEAFYRHQINDHLSITPGVIWLLAPNQNAENPDAVIATIRTTFQF